MFSTRLVSKAGQLVAGPQIRLVRHASSRIAGFHKVSIARGSALSSAQHEMATLLFFYTSREVEERAGWIYYIDHPCLLVATQQQGRGFWSPSYAQKRRT